MVRFLQNLDREKISDAIYKIFKIQELFTYIQNVDYPENVGSCVYAMWHAHQCCVHGFPSRSKVNIMISRSRDGEIIAKVCEKWGFKVVRGSKGKKGSAEATLQMINELKHGNYGAIMVDGPHGPAKVCKDGVVKIAKLSGKPIVPVFWYSPNPTFLKFPTWDKFRIPFFSTHLINLYGEPIYVDKNNTDEQDEQVRLKVEKALEELEKQAPQRYKEVFRFGIWKKKR